MIHSAYRNRSHFLYVLFFFSFYYSFLALLLLPSYVLVMRIPQPAVLQVGGSNFDVVGRAAVPVTAQCVCAGGMWIASTEMRLYCFRQLSQFYLDLTHRRNGWRSKFAMLSAYNVMD